MWVVLVGWVGAGLAVVEGLVVWVEAGEVEVEGLVGQLPSPALTCLGHLLGAGHLFEIFSGGALKKWPPCRRRWGSQPPHTMAVVGAELGN